MMKIAVTYTGNEEKQANYLRWLLKRDDLVREAVTILPGHQSLLDGFDGLVLSGGIDIEPALYGAAASYANAPEKFNRERDQFEQACYQQAIKRGMPILAICRGLQLVNVINGGSLRQDLGEEGNEIHRAGIVATPTAAVKAAAPADKTHEAMVMPGSLLKEIVVEETIQLNSAHHQSVERVAEDLQVSCISDDGIIEALEWKYPDGRPFLLCVQWHPERMFQYQLEQTPASSGIRDRFLEAVKTYRAAGA